MHGYQELDNAEFEGRLRRWGRWDGAGPGGACGPSDGNGATGALCDVLPMLMMRTHVENVLGEVKVKISKGRRGPGGVPNPVFKTVSKRLTAKGKETRRAYAMKRGTPHIPPEVTAIDLLVMKLYATDKLGAMALRCEYCFRGLRRRERCVLLGHFLDMPAVTTRVYRLALQNAKVWIRERVMAGETGAT